MMSSRQEGTRGLSHAWSCSFLQHKDRSAARRFLDDFVKFSAWMYLVAQFDA